jgi:hypothetical protein
MIDGYHHAAVTVVLSDGKLDEVKAKFEHVHYYPHGDFPDELLDRIDIWYTSWLGLPEKVKDVGQVPRTKIVQMSSGVYAASGADCSWRKQLSCSRDDGVRRGQEADHGVLGFR